jgi:hypothetical protein
MKYDGKLSISRVSELRNSYISIRLEDSNAHITVVDIDVPIELFGNIVTGLGAQSVKFNVYDFDKIGKTMEHKTEQVIIECDCIYDKSKLIDALKTTLKEYEIDGWTADVTWSLSTQRSTGTNKDGQNYVNVLFRRWV